MGAEFEAESGDVWMGAICAEDLRDLLMGEVRKILMDVAWREVRGGWKKEAQRHPELEMVGSLMEQECKV